MNFHSIAKKPTRQLNEGVFEIWKARGETLAALVRRFRDECKIEKSVPITYAGRLDPMAEGLVILLAGDARFEKEIYMSLDKVYRFSVLFGVSTDTYDVLGNITEMDFKKVPREIIEKVLPELLKTPLPYPPFSSKPLGGKPLFVHARERNDLDELPIQRGIPAKLVLVSEISSALSLLIEVAIKDIKKVEGDFRQKEIIEKWNDLKEKYGDKEVQLFVFEAAVPSGVYIRSIAHEMGKYVGAPSLAYEIVRTNIGKSL